MERGTVAPMRSRSPLRCGPLRSVRLGAEHPLRMGSPPHRGSLTVARPRRLTSAVIVFLFFFSALISVFFRMAIGFFAKTTLFLPLRIFAAQGFFPPLCCFDGAILHEA